jgi:DNA-binding transcriptional LysR family regulator
MRLTLRQLQIFEAIARESSVMRAAAQVGLSQSAASLALRELEVRLGGPLFVRHGKRLVINERGRRLRLRAHSALRQIEEIETALDDAPLQGTLRIGATDAIGNYLLPAICTAFMRAHRGVLVEMTVGTPNSIIAGVEALAMDVGFLEAQCNNPAIEVSPWIEEELCLFCAPGHPLARRRGLAIADLADQTWYLQSPEYSSRRIIVPALGRYLKSVRIGLVTGSMEAIKEAVKDGEAIGCLWHSVLKREFGEGSLVRLKIRELDLLRGFNILQRRDAYRTELQTAFITSLP